METYFHFFNKMYIIKFKSYYVVWKLISCIDMFGFAVSLNRTMQYGNKFEAGKKEKYKKV